jgi:hypothetical protein
MVKAVLPRPRSSYRQEKDVASSHSIYPFLILLFLQDILSRFSSLSNHEIYYECMAGMSSVQVRSVGVSMTLHARPSVWFQQLKK